MIETGSYTLTTPFTDERSVKVMFYLGLTVAEPCKQTFGVRGHQAKTVLGTLRAAGVCLNLGIGWGGKKEVLLVPASTS